MRKCLHLSQRFCYDLVHCILQHINHMTESIQQRKVIAVFGSIVVVDALTPCALLHFVFNLKAAQMNVKRCLIR